MWLALLGLWQLFRTGTGIGEEALLSGCRRTPKVIESRVFAHIAWRLARPNAEDFKASEAPSKLVRAAARVSAANSRNPFAATQSNAI
jgi:hypothetical protein